MNVEQALEQLRREGYKYTGKREDMIRHFASENRYMSAKELLELMKEGYPHLSFDTIYRNLTLFSELGILEETELNGERKYRFHCNQTHHHHHLICLKCGKTQQVEGCPLQSLADGPEGFMITGHKFEIYGYCQTCQ